MTWPTSRKYPRTMAEAFPVKRDTGIEKPPVPRLERYAGWLVAIVIGVALASVLLVYLP